MRQLTAGKIVKYGLIGFVALVFIFPIYWMIVTSLKPNSVIMRLPPQFLPTHPIADHYISVLSDHRFFTFYKNSVIVAVLTTGVTLMLAILASYSFSRFRYRFSGPLQMLFLSTQMFPAVVLLIALYTMYSKCGLINTYTALVLACTTSALPLSILVLKGFFDTVSATIEEAATIDGRPVPDPVHHRDPADQAGNRGGGALQLSGLLGRLSLESDPDQQAGDAHPVGRHFHAVFGGAVPGLGAGDGRGHLGVPAHFNCLHFFTKIHDRGPGNGRGQGIRRKNAVY